MSQWKNDNNGKFHPVESLMCSLVESLMCSLWGPGAVVLRYASPGYAGRAEGPAGAGHMMKPRLC